jgi:hypothetical protein
MFYGIHGKKDRDLALERFGISQLLALGQLPVTSRKSPKKIKHRCRSCVIIPKIEKIFDPQRVPGFFSAIAKC